MVIDIKEFLNNKFDLILDARSPKEYNESHIPGSKNIYVLNDEEHAQIGYMYKNVSKKQASQKGLIYILKNIAKHLEIDDFTDKKILIYCARGGKRSKSLYTILKEINYNVYRLDGGYKIYRKYVSEYLMNIPGKFLVLRGNSGCGKSELLEYLRPCIDLEKLANHYGSIFGNIGHQPSQKMFENMLFEKLRLISPDEYIFIEAESSRIGKINLPGDLHKKIKSSIQIEITAPLHQRINRILKYYGNIDKKSFYANLDRLKKFISKQIYDDLINSYQKNELKKVAEIMLLEYYDKVYKKNKSDFIVENSDLQKALKELKKIKSEIT